MVTYFYAYVFGASFTIQVNSLILCNPYNPNRPIDMYPAYVIILTMIPVAASIRCLRDISMSCEVISSKAFSYELKRGAILQTVGRYCQFIKFQVRNVNTQAGGSLLECSLLG